MSVFLLFGMESITIGDICPKKHTLPALAGVAKWVGASSCNPKVVVGSIPGQAGHLPRLQVPSLVWTCTIPGPSMNEGNRSVFLYLPSSLSKAMKKNAFRWGSKKIKANQNRHLLFIRARHAQAVSICGRVSVYGI